MVVLVRIFQVKNHKICFFIPVLFLRPSLRAADIPAWAATTSHSAAVIPAAATSHSPSSSASRRRFTSPTNNYKRPVTIASSLASSLVHYHHCHMSSSSPCKLCYFIKKQSRLCFQARAWKMRVAARHVLSCIVNAPRDLLWSLLFFVTTSSLIPSVCCEDWFLLLV
jgi:hypothetical protein